MGCDKVQLIDIQLKQIINKINFLASDAHKYGIYIMILEIQN